MSTTFIVVSTSDRYLELRPFDHVWTWQAPFPRYATHFQTLDQARAIVGSLPPEMRVMAHEILEYEAGEQAIHHAPWPDEEESPAPLRKLTRQEKEDGLADRGVDTHAEASCDR